VISDLGAYHQGQEKKGSSVLKSGKNMEPLEEKKWKTGQDKTYWGKGEEEKVDKSFVPSEKKQGSKQVKFKIEEGLIHNRTVSDAHLRHGVR